MITNYIKIAFRNLKNNSLYSLLNIGGLSLGLTACILITFYVAHENSYDKFHSDADRIFSVYAKYTMGGDTIRMTNLSSVSAGLIENNDPQVEAAIKIKQQYNPVIITNTKNQAQFIEKEFLYTDATFFDFFSFNLIKGNPSEVLKAPYSLVISEEMATKYFGNNDPIGKSLSVKIDSTYLFTVKGVMEKTPSNSSIKADFIASSSSLNSMKEAFYDMRSQSFQGGSFATYVKLNNPGDIEAVQGSMNALSKKANKESTDQYFLSKITDTHLNSEALTNIKYVKIFSFVAILILILALINYISLSTARSSARSKEIGIRKVNGAGRLSVAFQFFVESAVFVVISFMLAVILSLLISTWFFSLLEIDIDPGFFQHPIFILLIVSMLMFTILVAGFYPAVVMSSYKVSEALKGKLKNDQSIRVREVFTIFQFVIAVVLIIGGIIIHQQIDHLRTIDTGLDRSNIMMVPLQPSIGQNHKVFKTRLQELPEIQKLAAANYPLYQGTDMFFVDEKSGDGQIALPILSVDDEFINILDINWKIAPVNTVAITREKKVVINEAAISKLNLDPNPLGEQITFGNANYEIAGVVKDFHYHSPNQNVKALAMFVSSSGETSGGFNASASCLFIKYNPGTDLSQLIASVESIYKNYDQDSPFEYQFMDDAFDAMFKSEMKLSRVLNVFLGLILFIAGMGLFGYATFSAQQRKKEIGVRKVLGAKVTQITVLLSADFIKLVVIAIIIAAPIAWYAMQEWLQDFVYRIEVKWWVFALAAFTALIIAFLSVSFQAIKAATANPIKSLRTE